MTPILSVAPAVNAFLTIFFNLPTAIFNLINMFFGVWLALGIISLLKKAR